MKISADSIRSELQSAGAFNRASILDEIAMLREGVALSDEPEAEIAALELLLQEVE